MKPAGAGRLPARVGVGYFLFPSVCFFTAAPIAVCSFLLPPALHFHRQHSHLAVSLSPLPHLLITPGHGSTGVQLHSQGVQTLLGTRSPCSSSSAKPRNPSCPLPFCILRFDLLCTCSSSITPCPAGQTAPLTQAEGRRGGTAEGCTPDRLSG